MKVFEMKLKVYLLKDIETKKLLAREAGFIDSALAKESKWLDYHEENQFKNYCFNGCYPLEKEGVYKKDKIYTILESEFERRLQKAVREELENEQKAYESKADILNAAVSKLRMIFKNESSYEAMEEQVDGIENDEKNRLCKDLIKLIVPDEIARTVQTEMKKDYNLKYPIEWEKERLYRVVYSAYLTELKYFTKILQKKGENE